jgi:hypothetical protein
MSRVVKFVLAVGIPAIAVWILMRSGTWNSSNLSWAMWFTGTVVAVAAPQLTVLLVSALRSLPNSSVIGSLLLLDAWLVFTEWSVFHSNDIDGVGWLVYLAISPVFATAGMFLGKALSGLTMRWSQRRPT